MGQEGEKLGISQKGSVGRGQKDILGGNQSLIQEDRKKDDRKTEKQ